MPDVVRAAPSRTLPQTIVARRRRWISRVVAVLAAIALPVAAASVPRPALAAPDRYTIDPNHVSVAFLVMHVGFARVLGMFETVEGSFVFDPDKPSVSDISVTIPTASVFTANEKRDEHLRKDDFLNAGQYPTITFVGSSATQTGPRTGTVTGTLTIRGVAKPVTLDVTWNKSGQYPFADKHDAIGISARTTLKRSDFGMTYALAGNLVGDEVDVIIEFEGIRQPS